MIFVSGFITLLWTDNVARSEIESSEYQIEYLTNENYDQRVSQQGVAVVEFWASWNRESEYPLESLTGARLYRVDIEQEWELAYDMEIESLPTIFIYKNGELRHVDESDISFKRKNDIGHIQDEIDYLLYE